MTEEYLGDGLYASFDGSMIILSTKRGTEDHWVGLEMETFFALIQFANKEGWTRLIERAMKRHQQEIHKQEP